MKKFEKKTVTRENTNYFSDDQKKDISTKEHVIKLPSTKIRGKPGASVPPIKVLNSNESVMNMGKTSTEKKQPVDFTIKKQIKKNSTTSYFALSSDMNNTNRTT